MQVAVPVRMQMSRTLFVGLATATAMGCCVSCSASENQPRGPVENASGQRQAAPVTSHTTATISSSASKKPPASPQDALALPCDAHPLPALGDPRPAALSQHVPDRVCSEESECGDGFCDRGRCAPIWNDWYGLQCTTHCQCGPFLCLEGRCRSCLHHTECVNPHGGNVCSEDGLFTTVPFANVCAALGMRETHMPPEPVRPPPPTP